MLIYIDILIKRMWFRKSKNKVKDIHPAGSKKVKRVLFALIFIFIAIIGYVVFSGFVNFYKITADSSDNNKASFFKYKEGEIPVADLKKEGDGRINILLIGNGGTSHPGGNLADTIMVASIDPINKKMALVSLPRDLYVKMNNSSWGKINSAYASALNSCTGKSCPSADKGDAGAKALKDIVSNVLDLNINYYARVDFTGFTKLIDKLGGVDIYVDKAIDDYKYPDKNMSGYETLHIKAGQQHMDGTLALKYSRSRYSTSDFDRAQRQQKVVAAVMKKLLSAQSLTSPLKVTEIMNILGSNLRTDFEASELVSLLPTIKGINTDSIDSKVFDTATDGPLMSSMQYGAYIIIPRLGMGKYLEVQEAAHKVLPEPYILKENAKVVIAYTTATEKIAKQLQSHLLDYGYNITELVKVDSIDKTTIIYQNTKMPYTVAFLKNRLKADVSTSKWDGTVEADIVIKIGKTYTLGIAPTATPTR